MNQLTIIATIKNAPTVCASILLEEYKKENIFINQMRLDEVKKQHLANLKKELHNIILTLTEDDLTFEIK